MAKKVREDIFPQVWALSAPPRAPPIHNQRTGDNETTQMNRHHHDDEVIC
jgi:hypothetical protein